MITDEILQNKIPDIIDSYQGYPLNEETFYRIICDIRQMLQIMDENQDIHDYEMNENSYMKRFTVKIRSSYFDNKHGFLYDLQNCSASPLLEEECCNVSKIKFKLSL